MLFLPQLSKSWDYRHAQPHSEGIKSLQFFVFIIVCMECCVCAHVCAYTCVHAISPISRPENNLVESLFFFLPFHRFWRPHSGCQACLSIAITHWPILPARPCCHWADGRPQGSQASLQITSLHPKTVPSLSPPVSFWIPTLSSDIHRVVYYLYFKK